MKKFLFITTLTPTVSVSTLRNSLFEIYLKALHNQSYPHWEALLIGEMERTEGKLRFIKTESVTKSEKLKDAFNFLAKMPSLPDYVIRLDDDDIISPFALETAAKLEFDCYSDLHHAFYDLTSGYTAQQKRPWLPNTIIHGYKHAMAEFGEKKLPLFIQDHSKSWYPYYADKAILRASKKHPLYLRVISPTTITSGLGSKVNGRDSSFEKEHYKKYLSSFGRWKPFGLGDFEVYRADLISAWEAFAGAKMAPTKKYFNLF